jgi:hypothetical protein
MCLSEGLLESGVMVWARASVAKMENTIAPANRL